MSQAFSGKAGKPHLVRGSSGLKGEVGLLRAEVEDAFDAMEQSGIFVARFIAPATDAVSASGIKASFKSSTTPVTLTGTDFDGPLAPGTGNALIRTPKRVRLTVAGTSTPADWTGGVLTVIGKAADGSPLSEDVTSAAGAGNTDTVNYFSEVEQYEIPAQGGTDADINIGVLADTGAIASLTSSTSAQVLEPSDNAVWNRNRVGNRKFDYPHRISFVFAADASWITSSITVTGPDVNGKTISSAIAVPNGGGSTVITDKFFAGPVRIEIPAQGGALGTCQVGPLATELGLAVDPISDVEAVAVIREVSRADAFSAWSVPTAGAVDDSSVANSGPYGRYTPHSSVVPNGVREYALAYLPKMA